MYKTILVILAVGILILGSLGELKAQVLDFEGLTTSTGIQQFTQIPGALNYGGFSWNFNFATVHDSHYLNNPTFTLDNTYASPSGEYAVFNWNGLDNLTIISDSLFDFTGASFSAWANGDAHWEGIGNANWSSARSITVYGYNGATLVGSATMNLSADRYDWLQADINGIERLVISRQGPTINSWWLMDDFTYSAVVVPEPVSSTLFIIGGATLGFRRFRKK